MKEKKMKLTTNFINHTSNTNLLNPFNSVNDTLQLPPDCSDINFPKYMRTLTNELCHYSPSIELQVIVNIKSQCVNIEITAQNAIAQ